VRCTSSQRGRKTEVQLQVLYAGGVLIGVVLVCLPVGASASQAPGTESTRTSSPRLYEQSVGQDHARESEY
jgi:hypothetical protein